MASGLWKTAGICWAAWLLTGVAAAVEYNGVSLTMETVAALGPPQGTFKPVQYRLENRGPAQEIRVFLDVPGQVQLKRVHRLESGERVSGWFYLPLPRGTWNTYAQGHFQASKSGRLPRRERVGVSWSNSHQAEQAHVPRFLLVGQKYDLTGLQDALDAIGSSKGHGRGSLEGAFARVGAESVPSSWLGLAGITAVFLEQAPAEQLSAAHQTALADYVCAGGVLLVVSSDAAWCVNWWGKRGMPLAGEPVFSVGFGLGTVLQLTASPAGNSEWSSWIQQLAGWESRTGLVEGQIMRRKDGSRIAGLSVLEELRGMPVARPDFPRVSYQALWWLMAAFVIAVGPVNYGVLRKRNRLPWLMITTPVISVGFGAVLLVVFGLAEGRQAKGNVGGVTWLFQPDHQAVACQRLSAYATTSLPLQFPGGTLVWDKFGAEFGAATPYGYRGGASVQDSTGTIDCTSGWQLSEEYLPPRLVRAFGSLQVRTERSRLVVEQRADRWQVQNGLGVPLTALLVRDHAGKLFMAGALRNGETVRLEPYSGSLEAWRTSHGVIGRFNLPANSYIAVTPEAFGFEKPHPRLTVKPEPHTIYGIL